MTPGFLWKSLSFVLHFRLHSKLDKGKDILRIHNVSLDKNSREMDIYETRLTLLCPYARQDKMELIVDVHLRDVTTIRII